MHDSLPPLSCVQLEMHVRGDGFRLATLTCRVRVRPATLTCGERELGAQFRRGERRRIGTRRSCGLA
eukprot:8252952-Pyramimonas_sp.AAC.1